MTTSRPTAWCSPSGGGGPCFSCPVMGCARGGSQVQPAKEGKHDKEGDSRHRNARARARTRGLRQSGRSGHQQVLPGDQERGQRYIDRHDPRRFPRGGGGGDGLEGGRGGGGGGGGGVA